MWNKTKDKLPEENEEVLVYVRDDGFQFCQLRTFIPPNLFVMWDYHNDCEDIIEADEIIAWMSIPPYEK